MSRKKWILPACAGGTALLALIPLYRMGLHFMGPFRGLAVRAIRKKYPVSRSKGGIVFYGASNFARWTEMEKDLAGFPVQNHGFGGSADRDLIRYADRILYPYVPDTVVFQTGSNDYVQEKGSDEDKIRICMDRKRAMFSLFHEKLPQARFIVMSGLLLPGRSQYLDLTNEVNRQLKELCEERDYMTFVDASDMTYRNGLFEESLFVEDLIHLNRDGQRKWAEGYIIPALKEETEGSAME